MPYHTNETIFDLRERPEHLIIIGGGPIGMEMAQAHRRLGCEVTVIEGAKALGKDDPEAAAIVLDAAARRGGRDRRGRAGRRAISRDRRARSRVETDGRARVRRHRTCWWPSGARSNVDGLDLDKAGVAP